VEWAAEEWRVRAGDGRMRMRGSQGNSRFLAGRGVLNEEGPSRCIYFVFYKQKFNWKPIASNTCNECIHMSRKGFCKKYLINYTNNIHINIDILIDFFVVTNIYFFLAPIHKIRSS